LTPYDRGELRYPEGVRGTRGAVSLKVRVKRDGSVARAIPVESDPVGIFDAAAVEYVSKWRYCPRTPTDADFPSAILVKIEFRPPS
jgi:protein TonB